jgi:hypothetical protein
MAVSDGLASYRSLKDHRHRAKIVESMAAHVVLPWIHRVLSNFKRWALGTYHGARKPHLQRYLDEFVFRWNRGAMSERRSARCLAWQCGCPCVLR